MDVLDNTLPHTSKNLNIGVLGPSKAGKTTLIYYFETGDNQKEAPKTTFGFQYREKGFTRENIHFKVYDAGGQQIYQEIFWEMVVSESDVLFYVVDSVITPENNPDVLELHQEQFNSFCELLNEDSKVIFLLNKQDLKEKNPMNILDFKKYFPIDKLIIEALGIELISAKYGNNIENVLKWLVNVTK